MTRRRRTGAGQTKSTPNVRKILQSQKTFHNHLDDYLAYLSHAESTPAPHPNQHTARPVGKPPHPNQHAKRNAAAKRSKTSTPKPAEPEDLEMTPAPSVAAAAAEETSGPVLAPYDKPPPPSHPGDEDPLLVSKVPELPTDEELRRLLRQPMLSFWDARAEWTDEDTRYPTRTFCEVCGYWGRVKCMKCGTRVCALDCLETHREECATRYGY